MVFFLIGSKPYPVCVNREQSAFWGRLDKSMEFILTTASFPQCFPSCSTETENGAYPLHGRWQVTGFKNKACFQVVLSLYRLSRSVWCSVIDWSTITPLLLLIKGHRTWVTQEEEILLESILKTIIICCIYVSQ